MIFNILQQNSKTLLVAIFFVPFLLQGQGSPIRAVQEMKDNFPYFCIAHDSDIFLLSQSIDYINLQKNHERIRVSYEYKSPNPTYAWFAGPVIDGSFWSAWVTNKPDSVVITTANFNLENEQISGIDTLILNYPSFSFSLTKPVSFEGKTHAFLSIFNVNFGADNFDLITFDSLGQIELTSHIAKDSTNPNQDIFKHVYIERFEILGKDSIVIMGERPLVSFVNFELDIISQYRMNYDVPDKSYKELIYKPRLRLLNDSTFFGNATWFYQIPQVLHELFFTISLSTDTFKIDTLSIASNPEMLNKRDLQNIKIGDNSILTATHPDFQIGTYKANFPCSFYLTRYDGFKESWHKAYGGDHYYRMRDIELIDSCRILITGSIYDYFDNGFLQGFYAIVDCNGDLLTSNVELTEIATTVYPNPTSGPLFLEGIDQGQYVIFDVLGRTLFQGEVDGGEIDLGSIGPGTYFLKMQGSNQVVKFVKE